MRNQPVYVTKPYLPPFEEFVPYLRQIWDSRILTNGGPNHQNLEDALCDYLGVKHIALFANGTLALIVALQALRITGEVITTPYSFVATSHSLIWNGIKPVFVDVDPKTLNIDPRRIEAAITPQTTAILPVHCYGHMCDVDAISKIADTYNIKVIYDAAHAFGVEDVGGSILRHGDLSVLSFHATKVFNTFEGGAIVCPDLKTKQRIDNLKNFGHAGETNVVAPGINGKMSEFNAALGLLQLKHIDQQILKRSEIDAIYRKKLDKVKGISFIGKADEVKQNYSYLPILIGEDYPISRDELNEKLKAKNIFCRRYFYPIIPEFPMYRGLPSAQLERFAVARKASSNILCLPIYPDLEMDVIEDICYTIQTTS